MNVIVINGPMGIGKTTVGTYIADSNPGTARGVQKSGSIFH